jgi:hypothetical protein
MRLVASDRHEAFDFDEPPGGRAMFATIKSLIPEPRQADQPRHYVGRHRRPEPVPAPVSPAPILTSPAGPPAQPTESGPPAEGRTEEIAAA